MKYKRPGMKWREKPVQTLNRFVLKNLAIVLGLSFTLGSVGAPISELFYEEVNAATQFSDDASIRDYSREAVEDLVNKGGIKGYPDGTFRPAGTITRIEALSLLMNSVDPSGSARAEKINYLKTHSDGPQYGNYYENLKYGMEDDLQEVWGGKAEELIILAADIGAGMYDGSGLRVNGRSGWLAPVTRAEFAKMTVAVLEELGGETLPITDNIESVIGDYKENHSPLSTSSHYNTVLSVNEVDIKKLYSAGIVNGSNDAHDFNPSYNLTREQAATIVYKAVNKDKRTPLSVEAAPVEEVRENATIDLSDPNRETAIPGDTVVYNGQTYTVGEIAGVPYVKGLALDMGRQMTRASNDTIVRNGVVSDGSLEGIRLGDTYRVAPNGTGLWSDQWYELIDYYVGEYNTNGTQGTFGQTIRVGDDGWLELEYLDGWSPIIPDWL